MTTTRTDSTSQEPHNDPPDIVARAASYYRNTRYLMVAMLIGMGAWFAYDGWVGWPEQNRQFHRLSSEIDAAESAGDEAKKTDLIEQRKKFDEHSDTDILFQKALAVVLPPLGLLTLFWALRNSRGEFRLSGGGQTLHVPGHGAVRFDQVRRLDKKLWDRKGIAFVDYEPAEGGPTRRFKLDDFVYERKPIDEIYERLEQYVTPLAANANASADAPTAVDDEQEPPPSA